VLDRERLAGPRRGVAAHVRRVLQLDVAVAAEPARDADAVADVQRREADARISVREYGLTGRGRDPRQDAAADAVRDAGRDHLALDQGLPVDVERDAGGGARDVAHA